MLLHGLLDAIIDGVDRWHRTVGPFEAAYVDVLRAVVIDAEDAPEHVLGYTLDPPGLLRDCFDGATLFICAPARSMSGLAALEAGALFEGEAGLCTLRRAVFAAAVAASCLGTFSLWRPTC